MDWYQPKIMQIFNEYIFLSDKYFLAAEYIPLV